MKKAEAISILATSVRPREAKDRARYDEAVKMAIEALKCSETPKSSERTSETAQNVQDEDLISKLSEIRSEYNCFNAGEEPYYRALSEAIRIMSQWADGDTISRQAAIDIERNATVDTNPSHFEAHQKFTQFMDDAEISSFGRWQWSNGFNTALTAVGIDLKKLPSAQPEPRTGKWALGFDNRYMEKYYYCSRCGGRKYGEHEPLDYFCSNCGADMRGEKDG